VGKNFGIWTHKDILYRLQMDTCVSVYLVFDGLVFLSVVHKEKEFCVGSCKCF